MSGLPAGLAEPLHIMEPWPWPEFLAAFLVSCLAAGLLWRWLRSRRLQAASAPRSAPAPAEPSTFAAAVKAVQERARESSFFRLGCHELAELLRGALLDRHGDDFACLTAREMAARSSGDGYAELLVEVSDARFGRGVPDTETLDALCELAIEVDARESS